MTRSRLEAIRQYMNKRHLDAFIVTELSHVQYLTGFTGSSGLCIITVNRQFFFTDNRYKVQAPEEVSGFRIIIAPINLFKTASEKNVIPQGSRVGIESQHINVDEFARIKRFFPLCRFICTTNIIETIAACKDKNEIALIRTAVEITDRVFQKVLHVLRPGISEIDIAAEISYWHRKYGADADAFEPIVASGARGALPHARASAKKIKKGEMVVMDFGCRYQGYHSDLTRTVAVGKPSVRMEKVYKVVQEAQLRAIEAVKVGVKAREIDAIARKHIKKSGFGVYFIHSLGHGLGIHIHDPLRLSAMSKDVLTNGNVFTIEPGIYLPGIGGVRIEDDIAIYENRSEVLNKSPKELIIV